MPDTDRWPAGLLVEEQIAEAPDGLLLVTGFLKAAKGTEFAAERLLVIVKGAHDLGVVGVDVACKIHPIFIVAESELQTGQFVAPLRMRIPIPWVFPYEFQCVYLTQNFDLHDM